MYDQAIAERMIERYGKMAASEASLRVGELEKKGEFTAAVQWRRVVAIIEAMFAEQKVSVKKKLH